MQLLTSNLKRLTKKLVAFIKKSPFLSTAYILIPLFLIFDIVMTVKYFNTPRPAKIHTTGKKAPYLYSAKNIIYSAQIGEKKTNKPLVEFAVDKSKISFTPASGKENPIKPEEKGNRLLFKEIYPNIDMTYEPLTKGIKEEIIINKPTEIKVFPFFLDLQGAIPKYITENIKGTIFLDESGKYLFHFQKPFALDASGVKTDKVGLQIRKDMATGKYVTLIQLDPDWFTSSERKYPIMIDPTITHDESSEFTGNFNRGKDFGSGASPVLSTNYQELSADINTVGLWHMNEGTDNTCSGGEDVCDKSGNGLHGTFGGNAALAGSGKLGSNSVSLDGTGDFISIANNSLLNLSSFTIEAWAIFDSYAARNTIVDLGGANNTPRLSTETTTGLIKLFKTNVAAICTSNSAPTLGQWTHIAVTYDGTTCNIYIDGVLDVSTTNAYTFSYSSATRYIGYEPVVPEDMDGTIDEVKISRIIRTPEEIKLDAQKRPYSIYTSDVIDLTHAVSWNSLSWSESGVATGDGETLYSSTNLVAQWNFNETSGYTANNDAEGTSCEGTPANCDFSLGNFASTGSQDAAAGSGWTANNRKWGAGAIMLSSAATADTLSVSNPASNALDPNSANMTIELWVKTTDVTAELFSNNAGNGTSCTSNGYYVGIDASGYPVFYLDTNGATAGCDAQISTSTIKINDGNWHFLAIPVTRGTSATMYLDGKSIGSDTSVTSYSSITSSGNVLVGSTNNFDGIIDSIRFYSRALSQNEIISNYQAQNIEFQTRVGSSTDANDGTWEAWKPNTTVETAIDSMDNPLDWTKPLSTIYTGVPIATSSSSVVKAEGNASLKASIGAPIVDGNTIALYHLDETNGDNAGDDVFDESTNSEDGEFTGTNIATAVAKGIYGKARSFNGSDDYIDVSTHASSFDVTSITISFWLKTTNDSNDEVIRINDTDSSESNNIAIGDGVTANCTNELITIWTNRAGATANRICYTTATRTELFDGNWHHIAIVANGSAYKIYLDGSSKTITTGAGSNNGAWGTITATNFYIGQQASSNYFTGTLDEIKISNTEVTAEEIAEAYRAGRDHRISKTISSTNLSSAAKMPFYVASDRTGTFMEASIGESTLANYEPDSNTIGLYHLEEQSGSGAYFKDSSGTGNHGSVGSGSTFVQGKIGKARDFNGSSDYLTLPAGASSGLGSKSSTTVGAWVVRDTTGGRDSIIDLTIGTTNSKVYLEYQADNTIRCGARADAADSFQAKTSTTTVTDTNWHFLVCVVDIANDNIYIYLDGVLQPTSGTPAWAQTTFDADVGTIHTVGTAAGLANYHDGKIDELFIETTSLTADQIRQMFTLGLRTHLITIDFKAKLDSGNLITSTADTSFMIDATAYGASSMGSNLYKGDKIIVKEKVNETEYLAQGTVNAITASTGATTVSSWDSGSTAPSGGFTVNAVVFKWQREFFDVRRSLSTHRDALTRITLRVIDGSQGANVWFDDFKYTSNYLTTAGGSTILSSTDNRYFQYRFIESLYDTSASNSVTSVTLNYEINNYPNTPTFSANYLHDKVKTADTTPEVRFSTTDPESNPLTYQISWDTDSSFPAATSKTSDTDAGFSDITDPLDTDPFDSGDTISYTFQSALSNSTTYFYRVRAKDPTESNVYSSWSSTRSLTIDTGLNKGDGWFETHADQFSGDTLSSSFVDDTNNNVYTPPSNTTIDLMEYSSDSSAQTAYVTNGYFYATGGTIATSSGYTRHTFTSSGTFSVTGSENVEVLVVAGGGGGGSYSTQAAGGGGGGGMVEHSGYTASGNITVTVGNGGSAGTSNGSGGDGGNSVFGDITANGGGGGGGAGANGRSGGSGGGGGQKTGGSTGGSATQGDSGGGTGYGNAGGSGGINYSGNGGGAGSAGGSGGAGRANSISGSSVTYAAGGPHGDVVNGTSGTANTGNGGGGGGASGGSGGSGIVIVKYISTQPLLAYSEASTKTQGSYALRGFATATTGLNHTLTRSVSPTINLSDFNTLKFDIRSTRTGSNIKIAIHDSGGTTTETTPNVTAADTYQTKSWDISGVSNANKDAIDQIIITITNADANNTFYIDNFYGESPTGGTGTITSTAITAGDINAGKTNWGTATIGKTETYGSLKVQIYYDNSGTPTIIPDGVLSGNSTGFSGAAVDLAGVSTTTYPILYLKANLVYSGGSPTLDDWGIKFDNRASTPSLDSPSDEAISQPVSTVLKTTSTDANSDYLKYKIQVCTDSSMSQNCQTFDQTSSQTGWSGQDSQGGTAYASGTQATYTIQTPLNHSSTYYWRSYAKDPGGTNVWSDTQGSVYSFITSVTPDTPTLDSPTDTATSQAVFPALKTTATDDDGDYMKYKIELCKNAAMTTSCQTFDQTSSQTGWSGQNTQGNTAYTSGTQATYTIQSTLDFNTTYYWRSYAKDPAGSEIWSSTQTTPYSFTTGELPTSPSELLTEGASNPTGVTDTTPEFSAICNHSVGGATFNKYQIQVNTSSNFSSPIWDSGGSGTAMSNCTTGSRSTDISYGGTALAVNGTIYYWRIKFWDEWSQASPWSGEQAVFVMDTANPGTPTSCRIKETPGEASLTLVWDDKTSDETQFRIEKNTDGAGFVFLTNAAANATSNLDSVVSAGHTYQYQVRAERTTNTSYCITSTVNLSLGNFSIKGVNLKGVNLR